MPQWGGSLNAAAQESFDSCQDPNCNVSLPLYGIWNYGCWCNFGDKLGTGNGAPVNEFDTACKRLQQCVKCIEKDFGKDTCDIVNQNYNATFRFFTSDESLVASCKDLNNNDCAISICCCELQLIADILDFMWTGVIYDPTPLHDNGWNREEFCGRDGPNPGPNPGNDPKQCCGEYPFRYVYSSNRYQCCDDKSIFNPMTSECCGNGESMPIGNCPINRKRRSIKNSDRN